MYIQVFFQVIVVIALCLCIAGFVMHFTGPFSTMNNRGIVSLSNCDSPTAWGKCLQGEDVKKCLKIFEGVKPDNETVGCWVTDRDNDPCLYYLEGGPSPEFVPNKCAETCCTGGFNRRKENL